MQVPDILRQHAMATWLPWKLITTLQWQLQQQQGSEGVSEQLQDCITQHLHASAQLTEHLQMVEP